MNHFLLERSMRKGEKGIALSLADCDRRHGRPRVQWKVVDIGSWDIELKLRIIYFSISIGYLVSR